MQIRKTVSAAALIGAVLIAFGGQAQAQGQNLEKLKQMKVATTDLNIPVVPQTGANANAIRENLKRVKLPPGFKIELYAVVPDARHMAVAPSTNSVGMDVNPQDKAVWFTDTRPTAWVTTRRPANSTVWQGGGASTSASRTSMATTSRLRVRRQRRTSRT